MAVLSFDDLPDEVGGSADFGALEKQYNLPSGLLAAVQHQESGGNANAVSPKGAIGDFQFMPDTAKAYGIDPTDPVQSAQGAARMYADLSKQYKGDLPSMLAAYNWGSGNLAKHGLENAPQETKDYIASIQGRLGQQSQQYAQADTGNMSDATVDNSPVRGALSFDDLPDEEPSFLTRIGDDLLSRRENTNQYAERDPQTGEPSTLGTINSLGNRLGFLTHDLPKEAINSLPQSVRDIASSALNATPEAMIRNAEMSAIPQSAKNYAAETYNDFASANPKLVNTAGSLLNVAQIIPALEGARLATPEIKAAGSSILDALKNKALLADETSTGGPFANAAKTIAAKTAPSVDPRIAGLVDDASKLGINIPPRVFNPGATSGVLNKAGLMAKDTMKPDVTTALSKEMGHTGTSNLDVSTMENIQDTIGGKMNDFALKADNAGGIPIIESDLDTIADDSFADAPKVNKLIQKVKSRMNSGTISGKDYQELTAKNGALSKAMKSSDSDFADTAKEIREHLDNSLQNVVHPNDLADFQNARRQYRTMKIVEPLVESGGITGQADSAAKLFNAVRKNYGSIKNALKYNPNLGKIAQIANEFPEALKDSPKVRALVKLGKMATAPAAIGVGAVGGVPAGVVAAATIPAAKGIGTYLSSPFYKAAVMKNSGYKKGGMVEKRIEKHKLTLKTKLGRDAKETEVELATYVGPHGVKRLLTQKDTAMPAHKMFPQDVVAKHRKLFFTGKKPYTVGQIQGVL